VVAYLPLALKDGQPLRGRVRQEFNPMAEGILSMGVSAGAERGQDVQPYPVLDRSTATLTMREYESDPLVIHLHTEGDYWVRHVSLTHTDPRDGSDVEIPEKVGICRSRTELSSSVAMIMNWRTFVGYATNYVARKASLDSWCGAPETLLMHDRCRDFQLIMSIL
jgi:hypothetical protein